VLSIFLDGMGLLFYIIAWILMPKNPFQIDMGNTRAEAIAEKAIEKVNRKLETKQKKKDKFKTQKLVADKRIGSFKAEEKKESSGQGQTGPTENKERGVVFLGIILFLIGTVFLMKNLFSWFEFKYVWALALIAAGIYLIVRRSK
jgi:phage shock protein C